MATFGHSNSDSTRSTSGGYLTGLWAQFTGGGGYGATSITASVSSSYPPEVSGKAVLLESVDGNKGSNCKVIAIGTEVWHNGVKTSTFDQVHLVNNYWYVIGWVVDGSGSHDRDYIPGINDFVVYKHVGYDYVEVGQTWSLPSTDDEKIYIYCTYSAMDLDETLTEGVDFGDSVSVIGGTIPETLTDGFVLSESITEIGPWYSTSSGGIIFGDTPSSELNSYIYPDDVILFGESLSDVLTVAGTLSDGIDFGETLDATVTGAPSASDGITFSETLEITQSGSESLSDGIDFGDTLSPELVIDESLTDGLDFGDTLSLDYIIAGISTDGLTYEDSTSITLSGAPVSTVGINFGDVTTVSSGIYVPVAEDGLVFTENISVTHSGSESLTDGISLGDTSSASKTLDETLTDGLVFAESMATTFSGEASISDGFVFSELTHLGGLSEDGFVIGDTATPGNVISGSITDGFILGDFSTPRSIIGQSLVGPIEVCYDEGDGVYGSWFTWEGTTGAPALSISWYCRYVQDNDVNVKCLLYEYHDAEPHAEPPTNASGTLLGVTEAKTITNSDWDWIKFDFAADSRPTLTSGKNYALCWIKDRFDLNDPEHVYTLVAQNRSVRDNSNDYDNPEDANFDIESKVIVSIYATVGEIYDETITDGFTLSDSFTESRVECPDELWSDERPEEPALWTDDDSRENVDILWTDCLIPLFQFDTEVSDGIVFGESEVFEGGVGRDGIIFGDSVTVSGLIEPSLTDGAVFGETIAPTLTVAGTLSEGLTFGDSVSVELIVSGSLTDGIVFGEPEISSGEIIDDGMIFGDSPSAVLVIPTSGTDGIVFGDSDSRDYIAGVTAQDGIDFGDSTSTSGNIYAPTATDGIIFSEVLDTECVFVTTLADGVVIGDVGTPNNVIDLAASDGLTLGDSPTVEVTFYIELDDGVVFSDALVATLYTAVVAVTDGVVFSEIEVEGEKHRALATFVTKDKVYTFVISHRPFTFVTKDRVITSTGSRKPLRYVAKRRKFTFTTKTRLDRRI